MQKHTKSKDKFIPLTIEFVRKMYLENKNIPIKYYYGDGANPNHLSHKNLLFMLQNKYEFTPNGNLIIQEYYNSYKFKKTIIPDFLGNNFDIKLIDYSSNNNIFYLLEGYHNFINNKKSWVVICSRPKNTISDNCIGGPNWILEPKK
jgi:hypothetical protein